MKTKEIFDHFLIENDLSAEIVTAFQTDNSLCKDLIAYSRQNGNHEFALALINMFMAIRQQSCNVMPIQDIMFACFNLALQNQLEDCLKIWEAKTIDFDTFYGVDIQLMMFAGVKETIEYLKQQKTEQAQEALKYVTECLEAGDFDDLHNYFSKDYLHWYL
jgi:hypothetical protein